MFRARAANELCMDEVGWMERRVVVKNASNVEN